MVKEMLAGKVVVINGGTKGLGRGVAVAAGAQGAHVVIGGRNEADGKAVIEEIRAQGGSGAVFVAADIRKPEACRRLIERAEQAFGRVDGLVNYAGILPVGSLLETDEALFDDVFDTNIKGPFFCARYAVESMCRTGGGSIINVGSCHGYAGERDRAPYACSKGALLTLTRHIARNYARDQIRCNWITMGWVATPGELDLRRTQGRDSGWMEETASRLMPMGRLQTVEDNLHAFLYLLSDASSQVTGTELHITGGLKLG